MIKYTIDTIARKNLSSNAMKNMVKCWIKIATEKTGKQAITADILMNRANANYPHPHFQKAILASPLNAEKLAYIATGLILMLQDINIEATTHHLFEICSSSSTDSNGEMKKLIDDYKPNNKSTKWEPF